MSFMRRFAAPLLLFTLLIAALIGWENRWSIHDYIRLQNYNPPQRIIEIADATTMDDETRRMFYVYEPTLLDKDTFRASCPTGEVSIVLGCYVSGDKIYLADIDDERLSGIVEVTAAHEVLHVVYERLSAKEKSHINTLLKKTYQELDNERIQKNVEEYRVNGADTNNELHSILASEVRDLPPELEEYYAQYFEDRSRIVSLSEQYESTFTALKEQVARYDEQLDVLRGQIDTIEQRLGVKENELSAQRERLNLLLEQDRTEEYNAAVPPFNALVNSYNSDIASLRTLINRFNDIVSKRNNIATEQGELIEAIDSRKEPVEQ